MSLSRIIEDIVGRQADDAPDDAAAAAAPPRAKPRRPIGAGRRSRQARRDPQEPVNPRSAYTIFVKEKMEELSLHLREAPEGRRLKGKDQIKVVAQQWRDLTVEEKEKYQQAFAAAFAAYEQRLAAYKLTDAHRLFQARLKAAEAGRNHPSTSATATATATATTAANGKWARRAGGVKISGVAPAAAVVKAEGTLQVVPRHPPLHQAYNQQQQQQFAAPIKLESLSQLLPVSQLLPPGTVTLLAVTQPPQGMQQQQQHHPLQLHQHHQQQQQQQPLLMHQFPQQYYHPASLASVQTLPSFPEISGQQHQQHHLLQQPHQQYSQSGHTTLLAYSSASPVPISAYATSPHQAAYAPVPLLDSFAATAAAATAATAAANADAVASSASGGGGLPQLLEMKPIVAVSTTSSPATSTSTTAASTGGGASFSDSEGPEANKYKALAKQRSIFDYDVRVSSGTQSSMVSLPGEIVETGVEPQADRDSVADDLGRLVD